MRDLKNMLRFVWMPGTDIFTRRRVRLEKYWSTGHRKVLDAGFGNGWFAYRAYQSGADVTAVALPEELVEIAKSFYNGFLGASEDRLRFRKMNLYQLPTLKQHFDEIICYETLEHIRRDSEICESFFTCLNPGGVLHLCCPNAEHPRWSAEVLDEDEGGGHVRHGYTVNSYRELLEPIGFQLDLFEGVGGPVAVYLQEWLQNRVRRSVGEVGAAAVTLAAIPAIWLDRVESPKNSFSIYVRAIKPLDRP